MTLLEFVAGEQERVYVEVGDDDETELARAGAGDRVVQAAAHTWQGAFAGMRAAAEGALAQLRSIDPPPEEVEVTFGVTVDGKLGATLVSAGANAVLNVRVVWRSDSGPGK